MLLCVVAKTNHNVLVYMLFNNADASANDVAPRRHPPWKYAYAPGGERHMAAQQHVQPLLLLLLKSNKHSDLYDALKSGDSTLACCIKETDFQTMGDSATPRTVLFSENDIHCNV